MRKKYSLLKIIGLLSLLLILSPKIDAFAAPVYSGTTNTNVWYKAHVQDIGWQDTVVNGDTAGTTGKALKIEALQIDVSDSASFWIEYNAYIDTLGWMNVVKDGQTIGTTGRNLAMNGICIAIKDKSTGKDSQSYDVHYRVHVRNIGWESWTKNGYLAGDTYNGQPIEAIEIQIRPKGEGPITGGQTQADKVIAEAREHLGKPYVWSATGPNSFDCSGFTQFVYRESVGIYLPRVISSNMSSQRGVGTKVSNISDLRVGDLVITNNYNHVGIYVGNGQYINAQGDDLGNTPGLAYKVVISNIYGFNEGRRVL